MENCDFCGQSGATQIADLRICDDCYIAKGSCCGVEECDEEEKPAVTEPPEGICKG